MTRLLVWDTRSPVHPWLLSLLLWSRKREQGQARHLGGDRLRLYVLSSSELATLAHLSSLNRGAS